MFLLRPPLWVTGLLAVLLASSAALNVKQWKDIGAARAACELRISNESANRSQTTTSLETESLRAKIEALEAELLNLRAVAKAVALRHTASQLLLEKYRKDLEIARKENPDLDKPADTSRLRALEESYRVRAGEGRDGQVPSDP